MGYRPRPEARTARGFTRTRKTRSKARSKKPRTEGIYAEQRETPPVDEVVARTLSSFETLGQQVFASTPFHEYFEDWLVNLETAVDDFESSKAVVVDDEFRGQCSRILSETESSLTEIRLKESSRADKRRQLSDSELALTQAEREHAAETRKIQHQEEETIKALKNSIHEAQEELEAIRRTRAGFLAAMSRRAKELKEQEAVKRLSTANKELGEKVQAFAAEKSRLEEQHQHRRRAIQEQVAEHETELGKLGSSSEVDESAETRLAASMRLSEAVKDLSKRVQQTAPDSRSELGHER